MFNYKETLEAMRRERASMQTEIKTVPYVPLSHPFVERLIGTVRREYLDRTLFWTTVDLENKLLEFRDYFNSYRTHHSLGRGKHPTGGNHNPW